jgi:hypothetical protein
VQHLQETHTKDGARGASYADDETRELRLFHNELRPFSTKLYRSCKTVQEKWNKEEQFLKTTPKRQE